MDILVRILNIIGSLGLFLFGIKQMSGSLQRVTGSGLRRWINAMTLTPFRQVMAGMAMTMTAQSSSAVTVAIVSFVNAGFVTIRQSVGLILGSNIGTTITAWTIAILGFRFNLPTISIPLTGLGFALILIHRSYYKALGEIVIGFALMLFGLAILKNSMAGLGHYEGLVEHLGTYADLGYWSVVLFVLIGALLTAILQSSGVTVVLTMMICMNGWISLEAAAAMILGENVGTTVTANLAAVRTNTSAKRTALAHTMVNVLGLVWAMPLLPWLAECMAELFGWTRTGADGVSVPIVLAFFHTGFNVLNVMILGNFIPQIVRLVSLMVPQMKQEGHKRLFALDSGLIPTPELSLVQAQGEIVNHAKRIHKMFCMVRGLMSTMQALDFEKEYAHIVRHEEITDRVEKEIIGYLARITSHDNGEKATRQLQSMFRTISHIELIGDCNMGLANILRYKKESNLWMNQEYRDKIEGLFDLVEQAIYMMIGNLERPDQERIQQAQGIEDQINVRVTELRGEQLQLARCPDYNYLVGITFLELIVECEKLGNSAIHISAEQRINS